MALVRLVSVAKQYGREHAVDRVTFSIDRGEILGLVGPNGAGKTTLLRLIVGLLRPTSGEVQRDPELTPQTIRYFGGEHTMPSNVSARRWAALWNSIASLDTTGRRLGVLSRGTRQRVGLEAMIAPLARLLVLDEPWENLDPDASRWLSDALVRMRAAGAGIVVSSHRIHDLADVCDRCLFLVNGRLARGSVAFSANVAHAHRSAELFVAFDRAKDGT